MKLLFVLMFLTAFLSTAKAQLIYISPEDLIKGSDFVIEGTVEKIVPEWNKQNNMIYSKIRIKVHKDYKNKLKSDFIDIYELGGTINEFSTSAPYSPVYLENEKIIAFIKYNKTKNQNYTNGDLFGKYRLTESENGKRLEIKDLKKYDILFIDKSNKSHNIKKLEQIGFDYKLLKELIEKNN